MINEFCETSLYALVDWESWWLRKLKHKWMQDKEFWEMQSSLSFKGKNLIKSITSQKQTLTNHQKKGKKLPYIK